MAITSYSELQTAIDNWTERDFSDAEKQEFIALAEKRLNRKLGVVETSTALTGTVGSRELDISGVSVDRPLQLFFVNDDDNESEVTRKSFANLAYIDSSGKPSAWAVKNYDTIVLPRPCDRAYSFRFVYDEKFALSDSVTTNWLLENHSDVYLAAVLMWGHAFNEAVTNASTWKAILDEGIPEIRTQIAGYKRATMSVDPALADIGRRRRFYQGNEGW